MSTSIGHAFRFNPGISLESAIELCWKIRPKAQKAQQEHLAQTLAGACEQQLINKYRFKHELTRSILSLALDEWRTSKRAQDIDHKGMEWDTMFDVMLYRVEDSTTPIILGKTLVGQSKWHTLVMRNLPVKDYHYQDSSDKPGHINSADWRLRRKHWEEALPGAGVVSDYGLMVRLGQGEPMYPDIKRILKYLKVEDVIERQAKRIIVADQLDAREYADTTKPRTFNIGKMMERHRHVQAWCRSSEGLTAIVEETFRLGRCLPNPITRDHL